MQWDNRPRKMAMHSLCSRAPIFGTNCCLSHFDFSAQPRKRGCGATEKRRQRYTSSAMNVVAKDEPTSSDVLAAVCSDSWLVSFWRSSRKYVDTMSVFTTN